MTEQDCLQYCYEQGYDWVEDGVRLYDILDRVSCWCCRNKNTKELRNIWKYLPRYWERLKDLQTKISAPFQSKTHLSIFDLERRFLFEEEWVASGQRLKTRKFYIELHNHLGK